jgi:hypothetical protein
MVALGCSQRRRKKEGGKRWRREEGKERRLGFGLALG